MYFNTIFFILLNYTLFYNKYKKEQCSVLKNDKWAEAAEAAAVT